MSERDDISAAAASMLVEPVLLTTEEAARVLKVSPRTVQKLAKENSIPAVQIGKKFRFPLAELNQWIKRQASTGV